MSKLMVKDADYLQSSIAIKGFNLILFSQEVGVTSQYLSMILRGKRNPSPILAKKIADKLGLEVREIFFVDNVRKT